MVDQIVGVINDLVRDAIPKDPVVTVDDCIIRGEISFQRTEHAFVVVEKGIISFLANNEIIKIDWEIFMELILIHGFLVYFCKLKPIR